MSPPETAADDRREEGTTADASGGDRGGVGTTPDADAGDGTEGDPDAGTDAEWSSPREITRKPASLSGALALVAGTFVLVLAATVSLSGTGAAALGVAATGGALATGSRGYADLGGLALLGATVGAGIAGPAVPALGCAVGTVVAWDLANNAVGIGEQLGREAETTRIELVHAGGTLVVGAVTAAVSFAVYRVATGGQPITAVFFLLLAVVALVSALRV